MKKLTIATAIVMTGCATQKFPETIDEYIPANVASREKWDGSKGKFPPGRYNNRVIDYKGHGVDYTTGNGHINNHIHGHGGLGYHND